MGTNEVRSHDATSDASVARVDMKLEVVVIPVSDVDRAKEFYGNLGWRLDADFLVGERPGERASACGGRSRRAREAHRAARCELGRLVRRVYGGGAGRPRAPAVNDHDVIVIGGPVSEARSVSREPQLAGQTVVVIGARPLQQSPMISEGVQIFPISPCSSSRSLF
jgi:catechol 2,3-dioxygenase-like lactoylglutathione lyase family enzyme